MKTWMRMTLAAFVFTALCAGGYLAATNDAFRIRHVDVVLDRDDPSFIFPAVKQSLDKRLATLHGQFVWQVDIERLLGIAEKDRRIKDVKVTRILPNTIRVTVTPHSAIANILGVQSDVLFPIARDGSILPSVEASDAPDSPILRGEEFLKNQTLRSRVLGVLEAIPENGNFSRETISEVYLDKNKDIMFTLKKNGTRVVLSEDERSEKEVQNRVSQVSRVLNYLENQQMVGRVIDARYSKKVVVKLRNEP